MQTRRISRCCARIIFQRNWRLLGGLHSESKQWRIELLYRSTRAKTSRTTVLNITKLSLYLFIWNYIITSSEASQFLLKMMHMSCPYATFNAPACDLSFILLVQCYFLVVCCVGRVEIQIEIWESWCTADTDCKSSVSSVGPLSERNRANARNVRLYYPYRQYTNLFIFPLGIPRIVEY